MNLDDLAHEGRRYKQLGAEISALEDERRQVSKRITDELGRRKAESISRGGVVVTLTTRRTGIDVAVLKELARPGVFKKVTKLVADTQAVKDAIKAGQLTEADVATAETRSAPFPTVTLEAA